MSIETDPIPPLPQHTPPVDQKEGAQQRFTVNWMQWFTAVREKINIINALIVNFSNLVGTGFPALVSGTWNIRSITAGNAGITVANGDGSAGDPAISHADTSSVSNIAIDNGGTIVLQDVTLTFDAFGHVTDATFNSVDVAVALALTFQPLDATLTAIAGVTTAADKLIYFTDLDVAAATTLTPFIRTLLDDTNQATALTTLGAEPAVTAGTSAQFYRGDKTMTNELLGDFNVSLDNTGTGIILSKFINDTTSGMLRFVKARGTISSPAAVQSGDTIFSIQGRAYYGGVGSVSGNIGDIRLLATEGHSSTAQGTRLAFGTTPIGSTTRADRTYLNDVSFNPANDNVLALGTLLLRWATSFIVNFFHSGGMYSSGIVSMASLAADVNDWAITNVANIYIVRCGATGAARAITGIAAPSTTNQRLRLVNITTLDLTLPHESASSSAANRFACPGAATYTLNGGDSVEIWYDNTTARWRVLAA